jgi:hypothetical protein
MTKKRAQLTLIVILAMVIGVVIIGFFMLSNNSGIDRESREFFSSSENQAKLNTIQDTLYDCVDSSTLDGLLLISFQGGYYNKPEKSFSYDPVFFPYYYYEGAINFPSLETIESEMGQYVSDTMVECVNSIDYGSYQMGYETPQTNVKITKHNVYFSVEMPIEIISGAHSTIIELEDYENNYNSSLFEAHEIAEFITLSHNEDPEYYCVSCVTQMAEERDMYVQFYPSIAGELITGVMIYENRTGIGSPYIYAFFNKYTGEEQTPKLSGQ